MLGSSGFKHANLWNNPRILAGATIVLSALIVITPICGFMFDCGCTWPWDGLHKNCNFYDPWAMTKCPWCVSLGAGFTSVSLSIICGLWMTDVDLPALLSEAGLKLTSKCSRGILDYIQRVCSGLVVFLLIAFLSGWASASLQGGYFFLY